MPDDGGNDDEAPAPVTEEERRRAARLLAGLRRPLERPRPQYTQARESNGGAGVTYSARPHTVPRPAFAIPGAPKVMVASSEPDRALAAQREAPTVEVDLPAHARPTSIRHAIAGLVGLAIAGMTIAVCARSRVPGPTTPAKAVEAPAPTTAPAARGDVESTHVSLSPSGATAKPQMPMGASTGEKATPRAADRAVEAHPVRPIKRAAPAPSGAAKLTFPSATSATEQPWYETDPK